MWNSHDTLLVVELLVSTLLLGWLVAVLIRLATGSATPTSTTPDSGSSTGTSG
jgi:H+/gluconate symporter-like permease